MIFKLLLSTALLGAACIICTFANAQSSTKTTPTDSAAVKRAESVFVEFLGPGLTFSGNYDTRFGNKKDGIGGRIGFGFFADDGNSIFTIPVQLNYLLGKKNKFFEIGLGASYLSINNRENQKHHFLNFNDETNFLGTMTFGYRMQPSDGGYSFRMGFSPLFNSKNFLPWFGFSFGYAF